MNRISVMAPFGVVRRTKNFPGFGVLAQLGLPLLIVLALGCNVFSPPGENPEGGTESSTTLVNPTGANNAGGAPGEINVKGRLVFPRRAEVSFQRAGEVEEILVAQGDRVSAGQVLARLNDDHFPILEDELVRLEFQIADALEKIKVINVDYTGEPLLTAQREETVARLELANTQAEDFFEDIDQTHDDRVVAATSERDQAKHALDAAEDALAKTRRDQAANHALVVSAAEQGVADSELALDRAMDALEDYQDNFGDDSIRARDRITGADFVLDQARERLDDYRTELEQNTIRSQDRVTEAELALDLARDTLEDFIDEHDRRIIRARTVVGAADEAVDAAREPLTQFLRNPIRDLQVDGKPVDVAKLRSLQAAVDLAESNLAEAQKDLAELEEGPDRLRVQELESNITVAELNLTRARDDLAELEEGPDPVFLKELESGVEIAELNLVSARDDLAELEEGPEFLVLNQLETQVETAKANLEHARKRLKDEREGPDALIVPRLELNILLAQRRLDLAEKNLQDMIDDGPNRDSIPLMEKEIASRLAQIDQLYEGPDSLQLAQIRSLNSAIGLAYERREDILEEMDEILVRAPFDGVIYLLNVEVDDQVNKHSRVMEVIDPSLVSIEGFVDATDVTYVHTGSSARVSIDSMPGVEIRGMVSGLDSDPRTERGVISYPVSVEVELPPGEEVPFRLSAVDVVIMP